MFNEEVTFLGALEAGLVLSPAWSYLMVIFLMEAVVSERLVGVVQDVMRPCTGSIRPLTNANGCEVE